MDVYAAKNNDKLLFVVPKQLKFHILNETHDKAGQNYWTHHQFSSSSPQMRK